MADQDSDDRALDALRRADDSEVRRAAQQARESGVTIGRGMTSPDSTEVPLSAETGEPDERALGDRGAGGTQ